MRRRAPFRAGMNRTSVLRSAPAPRRPSRGRIRRAPLSQPLLVPRRGLGARRPRRAGGRARAAGARDHRPPGPVRRGPVLDRGRGRRAAPGRSGLEIELLDAGGPGSGRHRRARPAGHGARAAGRRSARSRGSSPRAGRSGPRPERARLPGHRRVVKEDHRGDRRAAAWAAPPAAGEGRGRLAEPVPARVAGEPRRDEGRARVHPRRCWRRTTRGSSRCPAVATASSRGGCGRGIARARGRWPSGTRRCSGSGSRRRRRASCSSWRTISCPTTTGSPRRPPGWPTSWGCRSWSPTTSTTRHPEGRELQDVLTAIRHGRSLGRARATCGGRTASRTSRAQPSCSRCRPATRRPPRRTRCSQAAGARGSRRPSEIAAACHVDLAFERYRFPGFPVPKGETPFQLPVHAVLGRRPASLSPADAGGRQAACPRARRHRAGRPRRVLPRSAGT